MLSIVLALAPALLATPAAGEEDASADWPCFGGPERTSAVAARELRLDWGEEGPRILWRTATGPGYGGAAVRDGEVYLLDREVGEKDLLRVFDLASGEEKWSTEYPAPGRLDFPGTRSVPTVDDAYVFTSGGQGQVTCFDRSSKEIVWSVNLGEAFEGEQPMFGWSAAPLLVGDVVVTTPLGADVGIVGLDKHTGDVVWGTGPVGHSHSTPVLLELQGTPQILFLSSADRASGRDERAPVLLTSFDPLNGSILWQAGIDLSRLPIPGPVRVDDEHVFVTGGYRGGSKLLRLVRDEAGETGVEVVFSIDRGAQVHQPLVHDGHVYLIVNENWNDTRRRRAEGGLLCLGLDGEERWRTGDAPFLGRGNLIRCGQNLLIQDGLSGVLRVVRASPEGYEELARADVFRVEDERDHQMWAPMALAGNRLLMRSQDELVCVQL